MQDRRDRASVGVVIPTHNRAGLLPQTLAAIAAQTQIPDEIVVVDDGSTDETAAVLARHAVMMPLRTAVIANCGDLAARNVGTRLCSSDLVAFCDSDDLWRPDHLERMIALHDAYPSMPAAYADFHIVRDGNWAGETKFGQAPDGFWDDLEPAAAPGAGGVFRMPVVARLLAYQPFFPSAMVVRRAPFLASGGWDESPGRTLGGDFATALRMAERPLLGVVRHPTVGIRKHRENRSADVQRMNLGDSAVLEHALRTRPALAPYADAISASIVRRRLDAFDTAFARQDYDGLSEILALIPARFRSRSVAIKAGIAALPLPLRTLGVRLLLALGTIRSRIA